MVTVAFSLRSNSAIGFPTITLRPTTTASAPARGTFARLSSSMQPRGVQGSAAGAPLINSPCVTGCSPSTSFSARWRG
jgi:hypothetical protein